MRGYGYTEDETLYHLGQAAMDSVDMTLQKARELDENSQNLKQVKKIINGLNEGAVQVASASGQVSASSQSMAEGASQQAASIEETSSSMEEMSSGSSHPV
jgi:methyl-accepting chemotaxis protein